MANKMWDPVNLKTHTPWRRRYTCMHVLVAREYACWISGSLLVNTSIRSGIDANDCFERLSYWLTFQAIPPRPTFSGLMSTVTVMAASPEEDTLVTVAPSSFGIESDLSFLWWAWMHLCACQCNMRTGISEVTTWSSTWLFPTNNVISLYFIRCRRILPWKMAVSIVIINHLSIECSNQMHCSVKKPTLCEPCHVCGPCFPNFRLLALCARVLVLYWHLNQNLRRHLYQSESYLQLHHRFACTKYQGSKLRFGERQTWKKVRSTFEDTNATLNLKFQGTDDNDLRCSISRLASCSSDSAVVFCFLSSTFSSCSLCTSTCNASLEPLPPARNVFTSLSARSFALLRAKFLAISSSNCPRASSNSV